ncbi:hypothetical protein ACFYWS_25320 [Streptomyces sp. NPDC002795]|uniref:hypothetical protein n=1 Tax=Streptomyces sp. NPDC002795 TaxID=3364665 RepID=UPI00369BA987
MVLGKGFEQLPESAPEVDGAIPGGTGKASRLGYASIPISVLPGAAGKASDKRGAGDGLSDVTQWLCAAAYTRYDYCGDAVDFVRHHGQDVVRAGLATAVAGTWKSVKRPFRRRRNDLDIRWPPQPHWWAVAEDSDAQLYVPLGHDYARWVRRRVSRGHAVPPQGFHLTPVLRTAASAEGLTHLRRALLLLLPGALAVVGVRAGLPWPRTAALSFAGLWFACYADRVIARARLRAAFWRRSQAWRGRQLWWISLPRHRSLRVDRQPRIRDGLVAPYGQDGFGGHHFLGAGDPWPESAVSFNVTPALSDEERAKESEQERAVRLAFRSLEGASHGHAHGSGGEPDLDFTPDQLHDWVVRRLRGFLSHEPRFNPENELDVFDVAAVSADRWPHIDDPQWKSLVTLAEQGVGATGASRETKKARRFLCVRMRSWDGELVSSVYVNFAYEHHFLRITLRPHVTKPIHPALRQAIRKARKQGWRWHAKAPLNALIDVCQLAVRAATPLNRHTPEADSDKGPVSVREIYSSRSMDDMLQLDDARRYVVWMERRVLQAVHGFLDEHGIDVDSYLKQATYILENNGIFNTGEMQNVVNQPHAQNSTGTVAGNAATVVQLPVPVPKEAD